MKIPGRSLAAIVWGAALVAGVGTGSAMAQEPAAQPPLQPAPPCEAAVIQSTVINPGRVVAGRRVIGEPITVTATAPDVLSVVAGQRLSVLRDGAEIAAWEIGPARRSIQIFTPDRPGRFELRLATRITLTTALGQRTCELVATGVSLDTTLGVTITAPKRAIRIRKATREFRIALRAERDATVDVRLDARNRRNGNHTTKIALVRAVHLSAGRAHVVSVRLPSWLRLSNGHLRIKVTGVGIDGVAAELVRRVPIIGLPWRPPPRPVDPGPPDPGAKFAPAAEAAVLAQVSLAQLPTAQCDALSSETARCTVTFLIGGDLARADVVVTRYPGGYDAEVRQVVR